MLCCDIIKCGFRYIIIKKFFKELPKPEQDGLSGEFPHPFQALPCLRIFTFAQNWAFFEVKLPTQRSISKKKNNNLNMFPCCQDVFLHHCQHGSGSSLSYNRLSPPIQWGATGGVADCLLSSLLLFNRNFATAVWPRVKTAFYFPRAWKRFIFSLLLLLLLRGPGADLAAALLPVMRARLAACSP